MQASLNAQRKRQRRQTAVALLTGIFAGGNNPQDNNPAGNTPEGTVITPIRTDNKEKKSKKKSTAQPRPEIQVPPHGIGPVYEPNCNDVLCGRGGKINSHAGNVRFRDIVVQRKKEYLAKSTRKLEKAYIAADIVRNIRALDPPGRFLKEETEGAWYDIGDAKAIKKVGQALREDAPDIRVDNGSDDDDDLGEMPLPSPNTTEAELVAPVQLAVAPIPNASISATPTAPAISTAVSSRGGKILTAPAHVTLPASQPTVTSVEPLAYQTLTTPPISYIPIVPPVPSFPGRRTAASNAAADAMRNVDEPAEDIAFGRRFHVPDAERDSSLISGMSSITGPAASGLSGMSGISALTDPLSSTADNNNNNITLFGSSFRPQSTTRPQTMHQFQALRYNQLQHLRQQWAQGSQRTLESLDMRSIGDMSSMQRSAASWQERQHHDDMSWADNSLAGGGIRGGNSIMSGQHSFHSYYLRDQPMGGSFPAFTSMLGSGVSGETALLRAGSTNLGPSRGAGSLTLSQTQKQQSPTSYSAQLYLPDAGGSNGDEDSNGPRATADMSLASESLSMGSILSDLSNSLVALDLAEPRILERFAMLNP